MQESNAFCPRPTELQDFRNKYLETGSAVIDRLAGTRTEMAGAIEVLREAGHEIVPLIATHGGSGGIVTRSRGAAGAKKSHAGVVRDSR